MIARKAHGFSTGIINTLNARLGQKGSWEPLDWQHEIFGYENSFGIEQSFENLALATMHHFLDYLGGEK